MPFPISSALFRRGIVEEIGGFDEELAQAEDLDLMARVAELGRVEMVPRPLGFYRVHEDSATAHFHGQQRLATSYVQQRLSEARAGRDSDCWEAFAMRHAGSPTIKRRDRAAIRFREAGVALVNRRPGVALVRAMQASAADPRFVYRRLILRIRG